jgi:FKBP-type peptidyl-prolyl cis-trans isomerase FklB
MYSRKFSFGLAASLLVSSQLILAAEQSSPSAAFKTKEDAYSYAIGASVGKNFRKDGVSINHKLFLQGMDDALADSKLKLTDKEFQAIMQDFQGELRRNIAAKHNQLSAENKSKADAFFAENGKKSDVVSLPSGVQYKIVKAGEGKTPTDADQIEVNYRGTVLDGTQFDASEAGKPATLKMGQLIAGWREALKLMPVGSKWQLFIPAKHGYGDRGVGTVIGPNAMLIFDVELVAIK